MKSLIFSLALAASFVATQAASTHAVAADKKGGAKEAHLTIGSKADELKFDKEKLTAKPGQKIELTFKNNAKKNSGLQHNWVLTAPGKAESVGQAGMGVGPDKQYVPDSPDVLQHTKLVDPGSSEKLEFNAPETPGDYPYICTFPGHYVTMKGVLTVK